MSAHSVIGPEIQGGHGASLSPRIPKLSDMTRTPVGVEEQPLSVYTETYLKVSHEAQAFYRFITEMPTYQAQYRYVQSLALSVNRVLSQAREAANIRFTD